MSEVLIAGIGIGAMLLLMLAGIPLAAAMALVGLAGTAAIAGPDAALSVLRQSPYDRATSYTLVVVPLFLLMGFAAARSGITAKLFHSASLWCGHRRGGLAMATVLACAGFAAICGSSIATAAAMCSIALPEMRKAGYPDSVSAGTIAGGATLGILIPPSIIFVLYGLITEQSIGKLLVAGIVPGIIEAGLFIVAIAVLGMIAPADLPVTARATWRSRLRSLGQVWEVAVIFFLVIGSVYLGLVTATESAALGVGVVLLFGIVRRTLTLPRLAEALFETVVTSGMIFFVIIGADIFGYFITLSQMPARLAASISALQVAPAAVLWCIIFIYIVLGALMDELSMVLLTVPIFFPLVVSLGYDPIWFGVIIVVVCQIGMIAPPVGINVFVIAGMARNIPMGAIYRGVMPFLAAQLVLLVLLMAWPGVISLLTSNIR